MTALTSCQPAAWLITRRKGGRTVFIDSIAADELPPGWTIEPLFTSAPNLKADPQCQLCDGRGLTPKIAADGDPPPRLCDCVTGAADAARYRWLSMCTAGQWMSMNDLRLSRGVRAMNVAIDAAIREGL